MAPSDGKTKPDSGGSIVLTALVISCLSQWVSASLSCLVGSLDNRILMKEYDCGDFLNKVEIDKSHKMSPEVPAHYGPPGSGNKSHTDGHMTFISPLNISVSLLPKLQAASCYIFKYEIVINSADDGHQLKEVSINANFSCDYHHLCHGQKHGTSKKLHHNGFVGELYCCKGDNCNKENVLRDLPPKQQLCYNGSSDGTKQIAAVDFCTQPETRCARARRTDTGTVEEMYFCDNLHHCQNHSLTLDGSSQEMCKMVRIGEKNIELCCCTRSKCYVPDWLTKRPNPQSTNPQTPGLSWLFIGGLVLMALVCAAILSVGWMGVRHCRRKARENILTLTYTRLTVSVPEPDTDDSQMLLE